MKTKTASIWRARIYCSLALALIPPGMAHAGAGANVYACVYLPVAPAAPMQAGMTPGGAGTHCMNDVGKATSFTVTNAGVTCGSIGYVEEKGSSTKGDTCATDTSSWPLSYTLTQGGTPTPYSGATNSEWARPGLRSNTMSLKNYSKGTVVCGSQALCTATSWEWDGGTQGPLYIIFQPQAQ